MSLAFLILDQLDAQARKSLLAGHRPIESPAGHQRIVITLRPCALAYGG